MTTCLKFLGIILCILCIYFLFSNLYFFHLFFRDAYGNPVQPNMQQQSDINNIGNSGANLHINDVSISNHSTCKVKQKIYLSLFYFLYQLFFWRVSKTLSFIAQSTKNHTILLSQSTLINK